MSLTGPFKFVVNNVSDTTSNFDFSTDCGATNVESLNSAGKVNFTDLAGGTNIEISGASTAAGANVSASYATSASPGSFQFDGGVSDAYIFNDLAAAGPTSETILSTGGANGSSANPDGVEATDGAASITSAVINAATNLVATLYATDYAAAGATLTVSGDATLVDLTQEFGGNLCFLSISATGLASGGVEIYASKVLATFTGGGGGGNELLYNGDDLSTFATAIDGGGGTGNILSAQLANPSNCGIFTNWQILDVTDYGGAAFDASLLMNDVITGVQFSGGDIAAETVLNIAPVATVLITGSAFVDAGLTITHSSAAGDSLAVTFNNNDAATALNDLLLTNLTSTGDATVSIASTGEAGSTAGVGYNGIGTLAETDGHLAKVIVSGDDCFELGCSGGVSTDSATTSTGNIFSMLTTIDASATTGGVSLYAGNSSFDSSGFVVSYRGLTLYGGSGPGDVLYNGATDGVTIDLNGNADQVWLGGSNASAALGTGASDVAEVGYNKYLTSASAPVGPELPGLALGDSVTFAAGATAKIIISGGAEWDGTTYVGSNSNHGVGQTTVIGAVASGGTTPGTLIDVSDIVGASTNIQNTQTSIAGVSNLTAAENVAVAALGAGGVAYFTYGSNEYLVAAHAAEAAVSAGDAVVEMHNVNLTGLSMSAGVVHLV